MLRVNDFSNDASTPGQPVKVPLHMPITLGLLAPQGRTFHLRWQGSRHGLFKVNGFSRVQSFVRPSKRSN